MNTLKGICLRKINIWLWVTCASFILIILLTLLNNFIIPKDSSLFLFQKLIIQIAMNFSNNPLQCGYTLQLITNFKGQILLLKYLLYNWNILEMILT